MNLYSFDFHGNYLGHIDANGVFFDSRGSRFARVTDTGAVYSLGDGYLGRIDAQGSFFAKDGTCRGYVLYWAAPRTGS
jgi:hypothetical protein